MSYLCVAIFVLDQAQARRDIAMAAEAGAEMVELRVDRISDAQMIRELVAGSILPCIVTCRPTWEGGQSELSEDTRMQLLEAVAAAAPAYIDIELKSHQQLAASALEGELPRRLIISTHDFTGRPERLYNLIAEMNQSPTAVNKVVWMARTIRDNLEAFELLQQKQKPTIALCMGEAGLISRVLARKFGGFLTFASLDASGGTASGQVPIQDMKKLYRWDAIGEKTKVYGVVAQPVMHSMSPAIHNAAFSATGYDGVYLPMLVEAGYESFKAFMETFIHFEGMDLSGLSVTIPHKENALRYLQEKGAQVESLAQSIGAVNTILVQRQDGQVSLRGMNTDYAAILDSITSKLGIAREDLARYRVGVIGAGGTGRTAVAALAHYGASVEIYNRTQDRADALAREFNGHSGTVRSVPMERLPESDCQIYINTTSLGMHPKVDQSPIDGREPRLSPQTLVFDSVYNPIKTKLLAQAEAAGARTVSGIEMFVRQAVGQFEAWTGRSAPADIMRQVIEKRLSR